VIIIAIPETDFDPTEVAVPWQTLHDAGFDVQFATPSGAPGAADPRVLEGSGFGPWRPWLAANREGVAAYRRLEKEPAFRSPLAFSALERANMDGLILPGGHAPGMRPYLESELLQELTAAMLAEGQPVGAICHGVLVAARARLPGGGRSALHGRKTTALPARMELSAWLMTGMWLGRYFRTYRQTVEAEVRRAVGATGAFETGPWLPRRDSRERSSVGFSVTDGGFVSARWPGDAHRFAQAFAELSASRRKATSSATTDRPISSAVSAPIADPTGL